LGTALDADAVREFLRWLESHRRCGARTRNQRLAAIKAFAHYVGSMAPEHLERSRQIREIRPARFEHPKINYLEDNEMVDLVRAVDQAGGWRDRALLLLLYNTGARVQELVDLNIGDLRLDPVPIVTLRGKGRKQRTCPLWARTAEALRAWLAERGGAEQALFLNRQGPPTHPTIQVPHEWPSTLLGGWLVGPVSMPPRRIASRCGPRKSESRGIGSAWALMMALVSELGACGQRGASGDDTGFAIGELSLTGVG
jgi:integrase